MLVAGISQGLGFFDESGSVRYDITDEADLEIGGDGFGDSLADRPYGLKTGSRYGVRHGCIFLDEGVGEVDDELAFVFILKRKMAALAERL